MILTRLWMGVNPIKVAPYLLRGVYYRCPFQRTTINSFERLIIFQLPPPYWRASLADAGRSLRNLTIAGRATWKCRSLLNLAAHYIFSRSLWANHDWLWLTFSREGSFLNTLKNIVLICGTDRVRTGINYHYSRRLSKKEWSVRHPREVTYSSLYRHNPWDLQISYFKRTFLRDRKESNLHNTI